MIIANILATTLYITPTQSKGGEFGTYGLKLTQKISNSIYLKIRVQEKPQINKDSEFKIRAYVDFDF